MRIGLALLAACASHRTLPRGVERPRPPPIVVATDPPEFHITVPFRLPHTFEPERYRAQLTLGETEFTGHVEIDGRLAENVKLLWLHGVDLVVSRAVARQGEREIALVASRPRDDQLLGLLAAAPLAPGQWTIAIDYRGRVREQEPETIERGYPWDAWAHGLFRRVAGGASYFFTQGEAIYAREIFPCIDEPDRKVPWQLTLDVPAGDAAASNTPIARETALDHGRKRVEFEPTPPLPSYLIAFAVGPFEVVELARGKANVPMRILELAGSGANATAARALAPKILDELVDWLGLPCPYPKLDLVAVPHTGWGAMENPGLVTFDRRLLEDPGTGLVIAHEFAHLWFGDLVTMGWWDDIWLNESFAEWIAELLIDGRANQGDTFHGSARVTIGDNGSLERDRFAPYDALFTGRAVLSRLYASLGESRFRDALQRYVRAHSNGNATTADLAVALGDALGTSFGGLLEKSLAGPEPTLRASLECGDKPHAHFEIGVDAPVCFAYELRGKRVDTCTTVKARAMDIALPACPAWLLPGAGGFAPYAVRRDSLVPALIAHWRALSPVEHVHLFDDVVDPAVELRLFLMMADANELSPGAQAGFLASRVHLVADDLRPRFDAWVRARFSASSDLHHVDAATSLLAAIDDPDLASRAAPIATEAIGYMKQHDAYHPLINNAILGLAARRDPAIAAELLDLALARTPHAVGALNLSHAASQLLRTEPDKIARLATTYSSIEWFGCDQTVRADLVALHLDGMVAKLDDCLADKAKLDPIFRAWLAPTGPRPRR